jgi:GTP-sensing pleiotropic transcriptional regulator CodY
MSHAIVPPAQTSAEDMSGKNISKLDGQLQGKFLTYKHIADSTYERAMDIARRIDTNVEATTSTTVPFNERAVYAASLLAIACIRGAQIS